MLKQSQIIKSRFIQIFIDPFNEIYSINSPTIKMKDLAKEKSNDEKSSKNILSPKIVQDLKSKYRTGMIN